MRFSHLSLLLLLLLTACAPSEPPAEPALPLREWGHYGGDPGRTHFSTLEEINADNVDRLRPLWTYHTGDADTALHSQIQCNPIVVDGLLYGTTPQMELFALDAATGEERWRFAPARHSADDVVGDYKHIMINIRGVAYWSDGADDRRIFYSAGSRTYAIDALTGQPKAGFGDQGYIDLHDGLGRDVADNFVVSTSPPAVYEDLIILGTRVDETLPAAPGHLRAYDARSGEMRWIFHTIPQPGEPGYETWEEENNYRYTGGANAWSGLSVDVERGMVFCGTGSASYDFYGGNRPGDNLYANCILALDAATGERRWHYQTVHHDVWDRDLPTAPVLATIDGRDAVVQPTKTGLLFVLDRETGEPLFPIEETIVPTRDGLPGEHLHATQPVPTRPLPYARQTVGPDELNPYLSEEERQHARKIFDTHRYGDPYLPPGEQPMILLPGFDGGAEWGGPAFDPTTNTLFINANNMAWLLGMEAVPEPVVAESETYAVAGERLYATYCRACHGADRAGSGNNPSLVDARERYGLESLSELMRTGRRMMPAFGHLSEQQRTAIGVHVLADDSDAAHRSFVAEIEAAVDRPPHLPYKLAGYKKFVTASGKPAIAPPWGTLTAIDLASGDHRWSVPLGHYPDYERAGHPPTGTENYGGPVATAGGLVFIAGTVDEKLRAFDQATGKEVWSYRLPAAGFATPAVYALPDGRQVLVIACGGGKLDTRAGDAYVAFALE